MYRIRAKAVKGLIQRRGAGGSGVGDRGSGIGFRIAGLAKPHTAYPSCSSRRLWVSAFIGARQGRNVRKRGYGDNADCGDEVRRPGSFSGFLSRHLHNPHISWFFLLFRVSAVSPRNAG